MGIQHSKDRMAYERDCPRCGAGTSVNIPDRGHGSRRCDNPECPWYVVKGTHFS